MSPYALCQHIQPCHTCTLLCPCILPFKIVYFVFIFSAPASRLARARTCVGLSFMPGDGEFKISKKVYRTCARFARCAAAAGSPAAATRFHTNFFLTLCRAKFTCNEKMHTKDGRHDVSVALFFLCSRLAPSLALCLPFPFRSKVFNVFFFSIFSVDVFFGGSFCADLTE